MVRSTDRPTMTIAVDLGCTATKQTKSIRGGSKLCNNGYCYTKKKTTKTTVRWECSKKRSVQCHGSVATDLAVSIAFCPVNAKKLL